MLNTVDRFTREFVAVEDEANRYEDVENIPVTTYSSKAGQSPADIFTKLFRTQADAIGAARRRERRLAEDVVR